MVLLVLGTLPQHGVVTCRATAAAIAPAAPSRDHLRVCGVLSVQGRGVCGAAAEPGRVDEVRGAPAAVGDEGGGAEVVADDGGGFSGHNDFLQCSSFITRKKEKLLLC